MRKLLILFTAIFTILTATAQVEHSIILDQNSFRKVNTDALTGVNIDPIRKDSSRNACARLKIQFANMSRAEVDALVLQFRSNTDLVRQEIGYYDNVLILEMTAKPSTRFYVQSPDYGQSNEVTLNLEGNCEYEMEARLNQTFSIVVSSNVEGAEVYVDGKMQGRIDNTNSCTIKDVVIGNHTLKLVYGSATAQQQIDVNSGKISFRQDLNVEVERFDVTFKVQPANATITIDNGFELPISNGLFAIKLPKGRHSYVVKADKHHPQSCEFDVVDNSKEVSVSLKVDGAMVSLTAPNNAEIWVNGQKKGEGNWSGLLYSGLYTFEARKSAHRTTQLTHKISAQPASQSYSLSAPTPIYGSLVVNTSPVANVTVDGKVLGKSPVKLNNILIGQHTVVVSNNEFDSKTSSVTISENETTTLDVVLSSVPKNEIHYTSTDGDVVWPNSAGMRSFGAYIVSNTYKDGKGVILFNGNVTMIGHGAFKDCINLKSIVIPDSVTTIGESAFKNCENLTSVTIGSSVKSIGKDAFESCSGLKSVHISDLSAWCKIDFGSILANPLFYAQNLYLSGKLVTELTIPEGITEIKSNAFTWCVSLKSVTIPNSVTSIGKSAFKNCENLTSVTIGSSVKSIGEVAFDDCDSLESVIIPSSVSSIGYSAFGSCDGLISVTIPNSVTSIGSFAFGHCDRLTSVYCYATTPPKCDLAIFLDCNKKPKVYVPAESVKAYKKSSRWKDSGGKIVSM